VTKYEFISGDLSHSLSLASFYYFESDVVSNFYPGKTNTELFSRFREQTWRCPYSRQVNWQNNLAHFYLLFQAKILKAYNDTVFKRINPVLENYFRDVPDIPLK
jgi:hypothetical protein